ncbi:MAG: hypothetical protein Q8K93_26215 [Reyranella sp.]|uniref:hypothetical protein n=1 Tax=Reyranella sp. TaxID=1929291 RepID=UPI002730AAC8|nr:hypothetical protein [Reyranella sp.]MDP1965690.1 hypothetical protein [Reyranella sp.]MDP2373478.1 hypothetical protein [Reyranella sp.]
MPAKRIVLDGVVMQAIELLGRDLGKDFGDLSDEAFRDLLKKHRRPVGFRDALRQSLRQGSSKGATKGPARRNPASP